MSEIRENSSPFSSETPARVRKKFATQMDEHLLEDLRAYAKQEGRQFQAVLEDAVEAFLSDKGFNRADPEVLEIAQGIMGRYSETLKYLAK